MPTWRSLLDWRRHPLDADIRALAAAVQRTEATIAEGGKRGRALDAMKARFGVVAAARLHHATDARWRVAEMRAGGGAGAVRHVDAAVNRMVEERDRMRLTAA